MRSILLLLKCSILMISLVKPTKGTIVKLDKTPFADFTPSGFKKTILCGSTETLEANKNYVLSSSTSSRSGLVFPSTNCKITIKKAADLVVAILIDSLDIQGDFASSACPKDTFVVTETGGSAMTYCNGIPTTDSNYLKDKVLSWTTTTELVFQLTTTSARPLSKGYTIVIRTSYNVDDIPVANRGESYEQGVRNCGNVASNTWQSNIFEALDNSASTTTALKAEFCQKQCSSSSRASCDFVLVGSSNCYFGNFGSFTALTSPPTYADLPATNALFFRRGKDVEAGIFSELIIADSSKFVRDTRLHFGVKTAMTSSSTLEVGKDADIAMSLCASYCELGCGATNTVNELCDFFYITPGVDASNAFVYKCNIGSLLRAGTADLTLTGSQFTPGTAAADDTIFNKVPQATVFLKRDSTLLTTRKTAVTSATEFGTACGTNEILLTSTTAVSKAIADFTATCKFVVLNDDSARTSRVEMNVGAALNLKTGSFTVKVPIGTDLKGITICSVAADQAAAARLCVWTEPLVIVEFTRGTADIDTPIVFQRIAT